MINFCEWKVFLDSKISKSKFSRDLSDAHKIWPFVVSNFDSKIFHHYSPLVPDLNAVEKCLEKNASL